MAALQTNNIERADRFKIFNQSETNCNLKSSTIHQIPIITQCPYLERLTSALHYYQQNRSNLDNDDNLLSIFMIKIYPMTHFINDMKHYKTKHANDDNLLHQLQNQLLSSSTNYKFTKCSVETCKYSYRHFSRMSNNDKDENKSQSKEKDPLIKLYSLEMDNLHFNLFHLSHIGFRAPGQVQANDTSKIQETKQDYDDELDPDYIKMAGFIRSHRDKFNRFKAATNKYNIDASTSKSKAAIDDTKQKGSTFCELFYKQINYDENVISWMRNEAFDTDTIKYDLDDILFCKDEQSDYFAKYSNLYHQCDQKLFQRILKFMENSNSMYFIAFDLSIMSVMWHQTVNVLSVIH